jgi:hypothetical protein
VRRAGQRTGPGPHRAIEDTLPLSMLPAGMRQRGGAANAP